MGGWTDDHHGLVLRAKTLKLYRDGGHTWAMKLSQLYRQRGDIHIITYSLPDMAYVRDQFARRPYRITLICHEQFRDKATQIKQTFPLIDIATHPKVHSKVLLLAPETIYLSSANFGHSGWHESTMGIRSPEAYRWYLAESFAPLWAASQPVELVTPAPDAYMPDTFARHFQYSGQEGGSNAE